MFASTHVCWPCLPRWPNMTSYPSHVSCSDKCCDTESGVRKVVLRGTIRSVVMAQQLIMDLVWEEMETALGVMQFMIPDEVCAVYTTVGRFVCVVVSFLVLVGFGVWIDAAPRGTRFFYCFIFFSFEGSYYDSAVCDDVLFVFLSVMWVVLTRCFFSPVGLLNTLISYDYIQYDPFVGSWANHITACKFMDG